MEQQSDNHGMNATQLEMEPQEEEAQAEETDPNSAKGQGEQKGYFVSDNMADASSGAESTIDKLSEGKDSINGITGIGENGEIVASADISSEDESLANKMNSGIDRIHELTGEDTEGISAESEEGLIADDSAKTTEDENITGSPTLDVANKLENGEQAIDKLLNKEKIG